MANDRTASVTLRVTVDEGLLLKVKLACMEVTGMPASARKLVEDGLKQLLATGFQTEIQPHVPSDSPPVSQTATKPKSQLDTAPVLPPESPDDRHERITADARAKRTVGVKVIKTVDDAEDALDIDPRVAQAGQMFVDAVRPNPEYDNEDHIAEAVLGQVLVKLKMPPRMGRDVQRWLAQNEPDRIPAGWR